MKEEFCSVMKEAFRNSDTSKILPNYLNIPLLYKRFKPVVGKLSDLELNTGMDFGCGTGGLTVLSKLNNINVVGFDKAYRGNPYTPVLLTLKEMGYPFELFDTILYPWPIESDSFEFCTSFLSLFEDYGGTNNHLKYDSKQFYNRLFELYRILKHRGFWIVGPRKVYINFTKCKIWGSLKKKKDFSLSVWSDSHIVVNKKK